MSGKKGMACPGQSETGEPKYNLNLYFTVRVFQMG